MKFTISKNVIDNNIDFLCSYNDNNDAFVPYRGIYFKIDADKLVLISAKNNLAARIIINVDEKDLSVDEAGIFLISSNILRTIIKKMDNRITFESYGQNIKIYDKTTKYTLTQLNSDSYPFINFDLKKNQFTIKSKILEEAINNVSISTSQGTNERLTALLYKCINIKNTDINKLRLTSTDSFRLSSLLININKEININVIIEAKNLKKLIFKDMPEEIVVFFDEEKIGISADNLVIFTNLTKLNYLDINNFITPVFSKTLSIEKEEFLKLINKVVFYNSDKVRRLSFFINQEELKLSFEVPELGISQASTKNITYNGKPLEMDIDFQFIKDAVSVLPNGKIYLKINETNDRIFVLSDENKNHIQLITPIRRY
ncbi:DNA polymerase III subunit beta [Mycoplasma sp. AC1221]